MSGEHVHPELLAGLDEVQAEIDAMEVRLAALEQPSAPEPPTPPTYRGPILLGPGDDGAVIEDYAITAKTPGGAAIEIKGTAKAHVRDITIRRCVLDGFDFSVLSQWVDGLVVEDVRVPLVAYCAFALFSTNGAYIRHPFVESVWRDPPYPTDGGRQNNAYVVKLDTFAPTDPVCDTVEVTDGMFNNSPLWQCLNAHSGRHVLFARNEIHGSPRPIFISSAGQPLDDFRVVENILRDPATTPGGTTNVQAISYGSLSNSLIDGNQIAAAFGGKVVNIDRYSGGPASLNVKVGTNPTVP